MITLTTTATDEVNSLYQEIFTTTETLTTTQLGFLISMMLENDRTAEDALLYIHLSGDDDELNF